MIKSFYKFAAVVCCGCVFILPNMANASQTKTLTGTVVSIYSSGITITNSTAATYSVELGNAQLQRKNGTSMTFKDIIVGDKIQATGYLWGDNSLSATSFRDLSLYTHTSTFSGKIISINPSAQSFTMQSKTYGTQIITTNDFTTFAKNGSSATFKDLILGMTVTVKGVWDRSQTNVVAIQAQGVLRLIDIYFTGALSMKTSGALTVIGNGNVIYGVDISKAKIENKSGGTIDLSDYKIGDIVHVWGKHLSGSVQILSTEVKDTNLTTP